MRRLTSGAFNSNGRTRESHSDDDNDSSEDEVGVEAVLAFRDQHAAWMYVGTHTVASTIIRWMAMAYEKGWRKKVGGQSPIRWSEDGQALFPNGERILIDDSTQTLQGQVTEAEKLLDQLSAGSWEKIGQTIDLDRISDNMARLGAV
ncbi:Multidrug transporter QDR2 [Fusarium oxysporum f. sp. albedinis]|nr:Multidrug transporter QDR2 [Fusarium oxysporum f. sp. albedinis]